MEPPGAPSRLLLAPLFAMFRAIALLVAGMRCLLVASEGAFNREMLPALEQAIASETAEAWCVYRRSERRGAAARALEYND